MDFLSIIDKKNIYVGHDSNDLVSIDFKDKPSLIITGETGSGKSILLDQIILQFVNKYTSNELGLISIDTSGVELNQYAVTNYSLISAINNESKSIVVLSRVLREIERRKSLIKTNNCKSVDDYNSISNNKLPIILVCIDDDKFLLRNEDMASILSGIIKQIKNLNIFFVLSTSDVYNTFFETDENKLASTLISFDYVSSEDSIRNNIKNSSNLGIGEFIIKQGKSNRVLKNFDFKDEYITQILKSNNLQL